MAVASGPLPFGGYSGARVAGFCIAGRGTAVAPGRRRFCIVAPGGVAPVPEPPGPEAGGRICGTPVPHRIRGFPDRPGTRRPRSGCETRSEQQGLEVVLVLRSIERLGVAFLHRWQGRQHGGILGAAPGHERGAGDEAQRAALVDDVELDVLVADGDERLLRRVEVAALEADPVGA